LSIRSIFRELEKENLLYVAPSLVLNIEHNSIPIISHLLSWLLNLRILGAKENTRKRNWPCPVQLEVALHCIKVWDRFKPSSLTPSTRLLMSDALFYDQLVIVRSQYGGQLYTQPYKYRRIGNIPEEHFAVRAAT
jgi:hypothetical protein